MPFKHFCSAAMVGLAATAAVAHADTASLKGTGPLSTVVSDIYINGGDFSGTVTGYIGSLTVALETPATSFAAYCVDPFQPSNASFQPYSRSTLTAANLPPVEAIRFADVTKLFGNAYAGSLTSATKAAGFQIALWEAWHDDGNLVAGNIQKVTGSNTAIFDEAQGLLNSMSAWGPGTSYDLTLYSNDAYQDYVAVVPEPGSYALLLAGLGLLGAMIRRGARQAT